MAGTDALGRSLPMAGQARPPQKNKFVGIFYFVWHTRRDMPYDNTKALAANPAHYGPSPAFHWWGEPAVGYFRDDDPWVARKNLQMLGEADHAETAVRRQNVDCSLPCRGQSDDRRRAPRPAWADERADNHVDFHWLDNVPAGTGDPADWWYTGESAPNGRFNYRFVNQR